MRGMLTDEGNIQYFDNPPLPQERREEILTKARREFLHYVPQTADRFYFCHECHAVQVAAMKAVCVECALIRHRRRIEREETERLYAASRKVLYGILFAALLVCLIVGIRF